MAVLLLWLLPLPCFTGLKAAAAAAVAADRESGLPGAEAALGGAAEGC